MAHLYSHFIEKLGRLKFTAPPSRKVSKAIAVYRDGDSILVQMANGEFCPCRIGYPTKNVGMFANRNQTWIINALASFGVVTKAEQKLHNDEIEKNHIIASRRYDAESLLNLSKEYGFKLTEAQKKMMGIK